MVLSRVTRWLTSRRRPVNRPRRPNYRPRLESLEVRAVPSAVDHFAVLAPSASTAGAVLGVTVIAEDASDQPVTDYTGTIDFSSSDDQATLPHDFTFTAADQGQASFAAILATAGAQDITVTDAADASLTGSATVAVSAAALDHFEISAPASSVAGDSFQFTVTAADAYGNTITDYTGTVHFSSSDDQATLPDDFTFTTADQGSQTFSAILRTAGYQEIEVADANDPAITGSAYVDVSPAALDHLAIIAPSNTVAGEPFDATVVAQDAYGNTVPDYAGTVHFDSSDAQAALPDDYTFTPDDGGAHTFTVTLATAGYQSLTVTDVAHPDLTASTDVEVEHAALDHFALVTPSAEVTADTPFHLDVAAQDAFGNTVTDYVGTVQFSSTDDGATLPHDFTFTEADQGEHTFAAILHTPGTQTVAVNDLADPSLAGSADVTVV